MPYSRNTSLVIVLALEIHTFKSSVSYLLPYFKMHCNISLVSLAELLV
uniref:Uncharacterized protein n=1 Tax=Arundo donax TaxID=35708 RepID=A0A0A8YVD8_ARUDO